jgi:cell division GTPase FtsZ
MNSYDELQAVCDSLCAISNDKIILSNNKTTFISQLEQGNSEIGAIVNDFVEIISDAGEFNIDFNDLKSFIQANKHFFHIMVKVKTDSTYEELSVILKDAISNSYSNINFELNEIDVICDFKINKDTPTNLVSDTRRLLEEISQTHNIKFTYGIQNIPNADNAIISLFISNSQQASDTYKKNDHDKSNHDSRNEYIVNSTDELLQQMHKNSQTKKITKKLFS